MFGNQLSGILESEFSNQCDNQLSGILRKTTKQTCILVCLCMYDCLRANKRISVTLVTTAAQGCASDLCMCARVCVLALFRYCSTVSFCLPVHTVTPKHKHETLKH
jgi:hypothetical protein